VPRNVDFAKRPDRDPRCDKRRFGIAYALPMDLRYFFDLRSPILEAFFLTASVLRLSSLAISEVGVVEKSFLSSLTSAGFHSFGAFFLFAVFFFFAAFFFLAAFFLFAILCFLSLNGFRLSLFPCLGSACTLYNL